MAFWTLADVVSEYTAGAGVLVDGSLLKDRTIRCVGVHPLTSAGLAIGESASDKIGFHGVAPVVQRSGAAQAAVSEDFAVDPLAGLLGAITTGSNTNFEAVSERINEIAVLVNEERACLVAAGLMKGSA